MGLNTTHNCWNGSYITFMSWRNELSQHAGKGPLREYWYSLSGEDFKNPSDKLDILLCHSDCDGEINWQDCLDIAKRLEDLLPKFAEPSYFRQKTIQFIEGLKLAHELKENVIFE